MLYGWAEQRGFTESVYTTYELREGDECDGEPFWGLQQPIMIKALEFLEQQGKAVLMEADEGEKGVKFLQA